MIKVRRKTYYQQKKKNLYYVFSLAYDIIFHGFSKNKSQSVYCSKYQEYNIRFYPSLVVFIKILLRNVYRTRRNETPTAS